LPLRLPQPHARLLAFSAINSTPHLFVIAQVRALDGEKTGQRQAAIDRHCGDQFSPNLIAIFDVQPQTFFGALAGLIY